MLKLSVFLTIFAAISVQADSPSYCLANGTKIFTASSDQYLFSNPNLLNLNNLLLHPLLGSTFDGPFSVSQAATTGNIQDFSIDELKYYNYISASLYCPYTLPTLSCCMCGQFNGTVSEYRIFEDTATYGTKALVTLHPTKSEIVVGIRGSVTLMNWLMDMVQLTVAANGSSTIKIHRGQYLQTMSLYNQITQYVSDLLSRSENAGFHVVVTGHSLGGTMASITTFFWMWNNQFPGSELRLVTFGQPRVGNVAFADYMNSKNMKMARVVARADAAAHMAPPVNVAGLPLIPDYYVHHMREIWINGQDIKFCSKTKYEDPTCSASMGPSYTIVDHMAYFDVDYFNCYFVEGHLDSDFLSVPGTLTPTQYIPPMPTYVYRLGETLWAGGDGGLYPLAG